MSVSGACLCIIEPLQYEALCVVKPLHHQAAPMPEH